MFLLHELAVAYASDRVCESFVDIACESFGFSVDARAEMNLVSRICDRFPRFTQSLTGNSFR
jgi:hypothetical protein